MTIDPAYASFTEDLIGSLEIGKRADYVVLSQDIMTIPTDKILATKVLATALDGETVYGDLFQWFLSTPAYFTTCNSILLLYFGGSGALWWHFFGVNQVPLNFHNIPFFASFSQLYFLSRQLRLMRSLLCIPFNPYRIRAYFLPVLSYVVLPVLLGISWYSLIGFTFYYVKYNRCAVLQVTFHLIRIF